jgi:hypothetical protein
MKGEDEGRSEAPPKIERPTILWLMGFVALAGIFIRGMIEFPRVIDRDQQLGMKATYTDAAALFESSEKNADAAAKFRAMAAEQARLAEANRSDPVGYLCFLLLEGYGAFFLLLGAVKVIRRAIRRRSGPARGAPSPTAD